MHGRTNLRARYYAQVYPQAFVHPRMSRAFFYYNFMLVFLRIFGYAP